MALTALDENGQPIDWWFIYKVPHLQKGAGNDGATGFEYVYFDPNRSKVEKSPYLLNSHDGALNKTLDSILRQPDSKAGYILYNDERPDDDANPDDGNLGHTKGVLAFDLESDSAFWMLHSWPKFADPEMRLDAVPNYGQTYLCVSLDVATAAKIAGLMATHHEPQVYHFNLPKSPKLPSEFAKLCDKLTPNDAAAADALELTTKGGMPIVVFGKNRRWNDDFWNNLVGRKLGDVDVETWIRGEVPPVADSDGIHKTFDIKFINLSALGANWVWPETSDHAKWGITVKGNWVCVADINRMVSQRKRGGGGVAFENLLLWQALSRTTLLLAPPGHSRDEAHHAIHKTHVRPAKAPDPSTLPKLPGTVEGSGPKSDG